MGGKRCKNGADASAKLSAGAGGLKASTDSNAKQGSANAGAALPFQGVIFKFGDGVCFQVPARLPDAKSSQPPSVILRVKSRAICVNIDVLRGVASAGRAFVDV